MDEPLLTARRYLDAYGLDVPLSADVVLVFDEALVVERRRSAWTRDRLRRLGGRLRGRLRHCDIRGLHTYPAHL